MSNMIDKCNDSKCQFAGVCQRFLPKDKVPKNKYTYYLKECPSYQYFIPK